MMYNLGDSLTLSEDDLIIKDTAFQFATEKLLPNANQWDEDSHFPIDLIKGTSFHFFEN